MITMKKVEEKLNPYSICFIKDVKNFENASYKAYADMARRTLKIDADSKTKQKLKENVTANLKKSIVELNGVYSQSEFNEWHKNVCNRIIQTYHKNSYEITYGQAQKWLNMLFKYLYAYSVENYDKLFSYELIKVLHMPIDSKIIKELNEKFNIPKPKSSWSNLTQCEYIEYQSKIRCTFEGQHFCNPDKKIPFFWEMINWSKL